MCAGRKGASARNSPRNHPQRERDHRFGTVGFASLRCISALFSPRGNLFESGVACRNTLGTPIGCWLRVIPQRVRKRVALTVLSFFILKRTQHASSVIFLFFVFRLAPPFPFPLLTGHFAGQSAVSAFVTTPCVDVKVLYANPPPSPLSVAVACHSQLRSLLPYALLLAHNTLSARTHPKKFLGKTQPMICIALPVMNIWHAQHFLVALASVPSLAPVGRHIHCRAVTFSIAFPPEYSSTVAVASFSTMLYLPATWCLDCFPPRITRNILQSPGGERSNGMDVHRVFA